MRELPVESYKEAIIGTVRNHDFTLIYAGTCSGKSTQIPQYLSECYSQVIITKQVHVRLFNICSLKRLRKTMTQINLATRKERRKRNEGEILEMCCLILRRITLLKA